MLIAVENVGYGIIPIGAAYRYFQTESATKK
jgi:hypothetical protein